MTIQYISTKSTVFHPDSQTDSQEFVLIFGDEVDTTDQQANGRDEVIYRGRTGWVRSDRLMQNHPMEIYCIDVGQGDSVFVVTPNGRKILVDGGQGNEAFQFLVWKYRLDQPNPNPIDIDLMVVSHADDDHIAGLIAIIQHPLIRVREIIHSGIAKYNSGFTTNLGDTVGQGQNRLLVTRHDSAADLANQDLNTTMTNWRNAIVNEQGLAYRAVDSTTGQVNVGDQSVTLNVLGPRLVDGPGNHGPCYRWLGSSSNAINGNSVVLRLDYNNVRILLPGDLNDRGARHLMDFPAFEAELDAHVLKAPHHGSSHFYPNFLVAVHPQIAVISSGESPDHGHPRANFIGAVGKNARTDEPLIFSTELVAQFAVDRDAEAPDADDDADPIHAAMLGQARRRFKKRLNGIINIRTDGTDLYSARRVAAGYQFVTYEMAAAQRDP